MDYVTGQLEERDARLSWKQRLFVGMLIASGASPDGGTDFDLLMESGDRMLQESGDIILVEN